MVEMAHLDYKENMDTLTYCQSLRSWDYTLRIIAVTVAARIDIDMKAIAVAAVIDPSIVKIIASLNLVIFFMLKKVFVRELMLLLLDRFMYSNSQHRM